MWKWPVLLASSLLTGGGVLGLQTGLPDQDGPAIAMVTQPVTIRFQAKVGDQVFRCGESYVLGTPPTRVTPTDFRFYVSDVALVNAAGQAVPVTLEQDGKWQYQSVALLDFEDKSGACANGTPEMRDRIVGTVPPGDYRSLRFTLGVPFELNHADATLAASPLNLTSLWWNWQGGYKFLRIDLAMATPMPAGGHSAPTHHAKGDQGDTSHGKPHPTGHESQAGFAIHLGSTACHAASPLQPATRCDNPNRAVVSLPFNLTQDTVIADLAALVASTNLAMNQPHTPAGCMASPDDRDCLGIMHNLGLPFQGQSSPGQVFFRVESSV